MTTKAFEDVPMPGLELEVPERSGAQICAPEHVPTGSAMTLEQAQSVTESIRRSLTVGHDLLVLAWQQRAWVPLGYADWDAYVAAEFADLALRPPREDQPQTLTSMRAAGMSTRAISAATDLSEGTVRNRLREAAAAGLEVIEGSTGTDGKVYASAGKDRDARDELIRRLRGDGQTVREISEVTGASLGTVQAALTRASGGADERGVGADDLSADFMDTPAEALGITPFTPKSQRVLRPVDSGASQAVGPSRRSTLNQARAELTAVVSHLREALGSAQPLDPDEVPEGMTQDLARGLAACALAIQNTASTVPDVLEDAEVRSLLDGAVTALDAVLTSPGGALDATA